MNRKLFVFDVDSTLLPSGEVSIPYSAISSINKLLALGHVVAIDSGRPYGGIKPFLDAFDPGEKYAIAANGGAVYTYEGKVISMKTLPISALFYFKNRFLEKGRDVYAYALDNSLYLFGPEVSEWANWEIKENGMPSYVDLSKTTLNEETNILKVMVCGPKEWIPLVPFNEGERQKYKIIITGDEYLEILPKEVNKAEPIYPLAESLGIKKEDIYCFGDGANDIEMLSEFIGIAMGEATTEAKKAAKFITKASYDDGIQYALEEILKLI